MKFLKFSEKLSSGAIVIPHSYLLMRDAAADEWSAMQSMGLPTAKEVNNLLGIDKSEKCFSKAIMLKVHAE